MDAQALRVAYNVTITGATQVGLARRVPEMERTPGLPTRGYPGEERILSPAGVTVWLSGPGVTE
jgi:hypothetical protein